MNETLSALVAFVGFLIVASVLVQSVQEALKNVLKLRGSVWERFFIHLYDKEHGDLRWRGTDAATPKGKFKCFHFTGDFRGDFRERMKRLKTCIKKADSAYTLLRRSLVEITEASPSDPGFSDLVFGNVRELARHVSLASGLRINELLYLLDEASGNKLTTFQVALDKLDKKLSTLPYLPRGASRAKVEANLIAVLSRADSSLASDRLAAAFQETCKEVLNELQAVESTISRYRTQIEIKVDDWITQVEEQHKNNMFKWTVVIAVVVVLLGNLDTFSIYRYFRSDPEIVAVVVQQATQMKLPREADPADVQTALDLLNGKTRPGNEVTVDASTEAASPVKQAKALIVEDARRLQRDFTTYKAEALAEEAGEIALSVDGTSEAELREQVLNAAGALTGLHLKLEQKTVAYAAGSLADLGLPVGWSWSEFKEHLCPCLASLKKLLGLALTAMLISFGAPFWNNILSLLLGARNLTTRAKPGT